MRAFAIARPANTATISARIPSDRDERGVGERLPEQPDQPRLDRLVAGEEEVERAGEPALEQDQAEPDRGERRRARSSATTRRTPTRRTSAGLAHVIPSARSERIVATRFDRRREHREREQDQADQPEADAVALLRQGASGGYPVQPAFDAPPAANAERTTAAPAKTKSQSAGAGETRHRDPGGADHAAARGTSRGPSRPARGRRRRAACRASSARPGRCCLPGSRRRAASSAAASAASGSPAIRKNTPAQPR